VQREAFLQAICENPGDDTSRLVYADWLEDQGDPQDLARAEFIRVQIELSRLAPGDPRQQGLLRQRQRQLLDQHREVWLGQLPRLKGIVWQRFWRGFVSGANVLAWKFYRRHAAALFAAAPVQFLHVFSLNGQTCRELTRSPYLARLSVLAVVNSHIGDEGLLALAGCPHLTNLQTLAVPGPTPSCFHSRPSYGLIGDAGAQALASSPFLSRLTALDLRHNAISAEARQVLRERFGDQVRV
jgi:uncharacterized protein (TIGR02996 family)